MKWIRSGSTGLFFITIAVATCFGQSEEAIKPLPSSKPLIAYWNFDEPSGPNCADQSGHGYDASPAPQRGAGISRIAGLFGSAVQLAGNHMLQVPGKPDFEDVEQIAFSAWILPTEVSGNREIFRKEDGEHRVLFSLQDDGRILTLGLYINGYVESDSRIEPAQILDGTWHHCAATFDGRWMRVYLDGAEVGSLERPGKITAKGGATGCIGSAYGVENFQGSLDDLRIYSESLTPEEIARLYANGCRALANRSEELRKALDSFYVREETFARTLATTRKRLSQAGAKPYPELVGILVAQLRADFSKDYTDLVRFTAAGPGEYLTAVGNEFHLATAERLVGLLIEYKPLTECQLQHQTPEQMQQWQAAQVIEDSFAQLKASGAAGQYSPNWITVMLEAGRRIDFRPTVSEAVAPYVKPDTPPTRDLSAEEALEVQQRDWLHQADNNPSPERIGKEFQWTRQLAQRITTDHPGQVEFSVELAQLDELAERAKSLAGPSAELYFALRQVKRRIMLKNPVIDFDKVLFVDMPFPAGSEWQHETRHRLGYMAVPGGKLVTLEGLSPDGKVKQLMPQAPLHGSFWRPDVSYDGRKIVFCYKPHNEKSFHLYEINVDGGEPIQLTDGPYDDFDPIYMPDGKHIVFSTTRGHTYVRCMPPTNAFVLARCERDGKNMYFISRNNEPDYLPSVMNDGRIVYTRWEYTDKPLWRAQSLWTVNPDGTQVNTFWGNQSVWPDLMKDARSIPDSRRVMFTGSAHHDWFSGSVGIIDPDKGHNFPDGLTKVTADMVWPESGNGPVDPIESPNYHSSGKYVAYYSPYPLSEHDFLVSARRNNKFVLYLMDIDGNRELIYEGSNNIFHAVPVRPRMKQPVVRDRVAWPTRQQRDEPKYGVIYSKSVYQGAPEELRGKARYLRILNIEPKTYTYWHKRPYISSGPVVSMVQSEGVKRVLGTVPIEDDGSLSFRAPAGMALHFQLLDENHRALQTMRSFSGVMPGETRGCLGCHEMHSVTPDTGGKALALNRPPSQITPPPWGEDSVSYVRYVQPVLDKYCGECHQGDGEGRETLDLTFRPGYLIFNEPYVTLIGRPTWGAPYQKPENPPPGFGIADTLLVESYGTLDPQAYKTPPPMTALSYKSRLIDLASSGEHYDVKVDPISLRKLILWVDTMCPYRGADEVRAIDDPEFQGVDWISVRPKIKTAPVIARPGPIE